MKTLLHKFGRFGAVVLMSLGVAGLAAILEAAPVSAANTYLWDDYRGNTQIYYAPNAAYSNYFTEPNGERFVMNCWYDNAGHRWFYGEAFDGRWGYVISTWVINQTSVRYC